MTATLAPLPPAGAATWEEQWQQRWDEEWLRLRQAEERLRRERETWQAERREALAREELRRREIESQTLDFHREREAWLGERERLQAELETLHAEAFVAWEDLREECHAWEAQREERVEAGKALVEELKALERRIAHQRTHLAKLQDRTRAAERGPCLELPPLTITPATGQPPDLIDFVARAWQDAADLLGVLAERQAMLEALQRFWLNEWESVGQRLAERDEALERRERLLAGRERWVRQREQFAIDAAERLNASWQRLTAEQARFAIERERHDGRRERLLKAVKTRIRQADEARRDARASQAAWESARNADDSATGLAKRRDELLAMNAGMLEERQALARERRQLRTKMELLRVDRALLRRQVNELREQVERLALAAMQDAETLPATIRQAA